MRRTASVRRYGKPSKRSKAERLFAELPQSPVRRPAGAAMDDAVACITEQLSAVEIGDTPAPRPLRRSPRKRAKPAAVATAAQRPGTEGAAGETGDGAENKTQGTSPDAGPDVSGHAGPEDDSHEAAATQGTGGAGLRTLTWDDVCPPGDGIVKIAEASFAEVYRVSNERGTSIIKAIRLESPIKPQTKAQVRAGLVDEEPHGEDEVDGELLISEWLADVPGFVVYKERYVVRGRATRQLLATHQDFHRRAKRQDPGRAQFYPSPSRYLDGTRFLVIELGDAGTALEDWALADERELWDLLLLEAVALARAEDLVMFEHRDLHEGNLCVRRVRPARARNDDGGGVLGRSGLDITILDYGLSRAEGGPGGPGGPVAADLERDLGLFTSTHAPQCRVYRQMRSFLLRGDGACIPPEGHRTPYARGAGGRLSWAAYAPYTNVLWLAYLYGYLVDGFAGGARELARFRRETRELWAHLDPDAGDDVPRFASAGDVVGFAVAAGWIREEQLLGAGASVAAAEREDSILGSGDERPRRRA